MFCTKCGKKLEKLSVYGSKSFDGKTGAPIFHKTTMYQCVDFEEGVYTHPYWNNGHRRDSIEEVVDNIDGLETSRFDNL